jgi:2-polyprenyl-6-methoxyphenol hydroxylase-like FAD-dependent oxidoreductase
MAYWLLRHGHRPTLIESAPALRTGGYVIDFWGAGYDVADRMGLIPQLSRVGYHVREVRIVDQHGRRRAGFSTEVFARMTHGRFVSLPRSALASALYGSLGDKVETLFGDSISALAQQGGKVQVKFARANAREFDLVVGADGLHSNVRRLAFGPERNFEKDLGYRVAAFSVSGYRPREPDVYVMHRRVGQQVARFSMREDRTLFLFTFRAHPGQDAPPDDPAAARALLADRFGAGGWECPAIVAAMAESDDFYFDRVSQIHMPRWSSGRIALVGDAAFCVSLLAGQGSALAMAAAYVLAGEIARAPSDPAQAFERYQQHLGGFLAAKQRAATRFAGFFAPRSRLAILVQDGLTRLLALPVVADLTVGRDLADRIDLPDYSPPASPAGFDSMTSAT